MTDWDEIEADEPAWSRLAYHEHQEHYFRLRGEHASADDHARKRDHWRRICDLDRERMRALGLVARELAAQDEVDIPEGD